MPIESLEKSEITGKIIGAAMTVHSELGPHYLEVIYQRALEVELKAIGLNYSREENIPIYYKGEKLDTRRADFIIDGVLVEIKAKSQLEERDF